MANGGLCGMYNFRKMHSATAKQSKYTNIVKPIEMLEKEKFEKGQQMEIEREDKKVQEA